MSFVLQGFTFPWEVDLIDSVRGFGGDKHLSMVLVKTKSNNEYVVWGYNHQTNGCFNGTYTKDKKEARTEFNKRRKRLLRVTSTVKS